MVPEPRRVLSSNIPRRPPALRFSAALALVIATGCAAPAPVPPEPAPPLVVARVPEPDAGPPVVAPPPAPPPPPTVTFRPVRPAATSYEQQRKPAPDRPGLARSLAAAVRKARKRDAPVRDGALDGVAGELARRGEAPSFELLQFLLGHLGVFESEPLVLRYAVEAGGERALLARSTAELRATLAGRGWNRYGVGVARVAGQTSAIVLLVEEGAALDPLPREVASGGAVTVTGRLARGLRDPELVITTGGGRVVRPPVTRRPDGSFAGELRCDEGDGPYQLELAAHGKRGLRVVANVVVHCGVEPPRELALAADGDEAPADLAAAERELLALVNADRARKGTPALQWDDRLADVARAHAVDMAAEGRVAHVSPRTGAPADRVSKAGLRPVLAAENVGTGPTVAAIHRAMMASPVHRVNVLDPGFVTAGFGLAKGRAREGTAAPLYATQLFAKWK